MISETYAPAEVPVRRSPLDRGVDLSRINPEWLAYGLLFLASIVLHFWQLGQMAMAHDESIHAWASFRFFTGRGSFECAGGRTSVTYCYEPTYHGPTLYFLTLFSYFLFGDGDAVARLPQTLAGIALVPACYLLRPLFGKRPTLIGAVLVTLSPSILYFARYARHDALMLLWTLLFVAGLFRWIERGGTADLVLAAASLALAWATHELVFILIFIVGTFLIFRLFWESRPRLFVILAALGLNLAIIVALATVATSSNPILNKILDRLLGPAMLGGAGALMALLLTRSWPASGMLTSRLRATWATRASADEARPRTIMGSLPASVWWALGTFLLIFGILFSTFLAYPRGFLDGWYQGLKYWWFSQQDFRRGGQPWFYYLMLLPTYELMALVFALGGIVRLSWGHRNRLTSRSSNAERTIAPPAGQGPVDGDHPPVGRRTADGNHRAAVYEARDGGATPGAHGLFVPFLAYWSVLSLIAFSWAGEKMPWLVIQIALPVTLLAAWVLSELIGGVPWRMVGRRYGWSVPPLVLAAIVLGGVAVYYLSGGGATLAALRDRLRALPALAMFGAAIFGLVAVAANIGVRNVLRLAALTVAAILLLYGIRAAVQVVYLHPDTPVEPLIYTQTAPDVPVFVDQIQRLAINQTRNNRSTDDPTGGYSMKVTVDKDLAWPFQWYLRDFRSVTWADCQKNQCTGGDAPVVLLHKPNITETIRDQLAEDYVRTGQGVFNWWFPENYKELRKQAPWAVLSWPFRPANWPTLTRFMIYREVPYPLGAREMEVFMRREVAPVGGASAATRVPTEPLAVQATVGVGQLSGPRGVAADSAGNIYVADAFNHRIAVFDPGGKLLRTVGSKGTRPGQLYEPSGVAVDADGNLYVADTWNARIAKFDRNGNWLKAWGSGRDDFGDGRRATDTKGDAQANAANPLGFYGPRNVLVAGDRVYIADTGNKRIVVTDREGKFIEQWGTAGQAPGQFDEPIGLGADRAGRIYVGDTWNGRIQIFSRDAAGRIDAKPQQVVPVSGWEKGTYNDPYLAVVQDGRILVSLAGRNAVGIYNAAGTLERRLAGDAQQLNPPKGLAIAPDGSAYVVGGAGQVLRFRLP